MTIPPAQRAAVIDLGSNTARLVLYYFRAGHSYHLEDEIRAVVRLREGLTASGLSSKAEERAFSVLQLFKDYCSAVGPEVIIPVATSAIREAANGAAFVKKVREEFGFDLRVLTGEQEAFYSCLGALNSVPCRDGLVMDTGGGSVQLGRLVDGRFESGQALELGALTLKERFVRSDPIKKREIKDIQNEIDRRLEKFSGWETAGRRLVGLGGTTRNLAKIQAKRQAFPLDHMNGFVLRRTSVGKIIRTLRRLPVQERGKLPGLSRDRADIILPGALVVQAVMDRLGVDELTLSAYGIREGLFLEHFWSDSPTKGPLELREFSLLNAARFYRYQEKHAHHVRHLCRRLFDQLAPLHGCGPDHRLLLDAASLLHDIGSAVSYNDHHKHSRMLIVSHGLPGFSPRETAVIALLAFYHRKGDPGIREFRSLLRPEDEAVVRHLAALLRLAECLERGRSGHVKDIRLSWSDSELTVTLIADTEPTVEIWDARQLASELLGQVYGRPVVFKSAKS